MLQALAHQAHGDVAQAVAVLSRALGETPEPESHVRLYLDEGAPMLALLHEAANVNDPASGHGDGDPQGGVPAQARRLLERAEPPQSTERKQSLVEPLSHRELEVLRLLDSELTGPEIARQLFVTLNTLRTHTKRIFTKLDVKTRAAAVHRAREGGLL